MKVILYKPNVNKILKESPINSIDVYELIQGKSDLADKVFAYLLDLFFGINDKKSDNYIAKLLYSIKIFCDFFTDNQIILSNAHINSLNEIDRKFKYLSNEKLITPNEEMNKSIEEIKKYIKDNYNTELESNTSDKEYELLQKIEKLEQELHQLTNQLSDRDITIQQLNSKIDKLKKNIQQLQQDNKKLNEELNAQNIHNKSLTEENDNLKTRLENETNKNIQLLNINNDLNERIKKLNSEIESLSSAVNKLNLILSEIAESKKEKVSNDLRNQILDDYILSKLLYQKYTLDQICSLINIDQLDYSIEEIKASLKRIKSKVNIINSSKQTLPAEYKACYPSLMTGQDLIIRNYSDSYDFIVTADWHLNLEKMDNEMKKHIDSLYKYCADHKIGLIVNLGDFIDVVEKDRLCRYYDNMILLDRILKEVPKNDTISHAILGGNHDRRLMRIGVDPLKYLSDNRNDFINLGYDDAQIIFGNHGNNQAIGIHHLMVEKMFFDNYKDNSNAILNYLQNYYNKINRKDLNFFINLFGHFHASRIDNVNEFGFVPQFTMYPSRSLSSIWHVTLNFDQKNEIESMVIKSLLNNDRLDLMNENIYKKVKKI